MRRPAVAGTPHTVLLLALLVAGAYVGAGQIGVDSGTVQASVSAAWPASGIGLAAVLLGGRRMLWPVGLGGLIAALSTGEPALAALVGTLACVLEPWLAAELLSRVGFRRTLSRTQDVVAFVGLAAVISTAVGAAVGALSILAAGHLHASGLFGVWRDWWLGDFSGTLVGASAILVLWNRPLSDLRSRAALEPLIVSVCVGMLSFAILDNAGTLPYLVLPLLFILAFTYRQRGAVIGGLFVWAITIELTARGHAPFPAGNLAAEFIRAQTFVCVGSVTALLVAAAQSERRVAEQAVDRLAESESALAEAQRLARIGSFETDLETGRTAWSQELYRILGQDPEAIDPGWPAWRRCVHPEDVTRVDQVVKAALTERGGASIVHRIVRPDDQVRTLDARIRFVEDASGPRFVGTCQDITAMRVAEERFRSLFQHAPYAIVVIDETGRITLGNLRSEQLFGLTAAEMAGCPAEELVPSAAGSERPWYLAGSAETAAPGGELELRGLRRDGSDFPIEVSLTPLVAESGTLVSATIRDVTEDRAVAESLTYEARHDALTGLPNRVLFLERLELALARARRSERFLAVIFLDLDDFKLVNDTRGHETGDALLRALPTRLNAAVRHGDTVARLGGDEFVMLCEDLSGEADAIEIAQRVTGMPLDGLVVDGFEHAVSISAGVVIVPDAAGVSGDAVLRDADAAMYAAKEAGKGRFVVFDESMRERLLERIAIESSLRGARSRGELTLFYQPVIALDHNRVVAVEALLRWRHPARGMLAPHDFMGVAESTGLIAEIGEWVIDEACRQAVVWRDAAGPGASIPISVNVSAHQLTRTDLAGTVQSTLSDTGLEPHLLALEFTESTLLEDIAASRRELLRLKQLGVRLVIDDFGTGYSSLSALRNLMIDGLKLDPSFVHALSSDAEDGGMVGAVLSMAGALDAEVTAEGVETWAQVRRLRSHGCDYAQGYLFARPAPADTLTELIGAGREPAGEIAG